MNGYGYVCNLGASWFLFHPLFYWASTLTGLPLFTLITLPSRVSLLEGLLWNRIQHYK